MEGKSSPPGREAERASLGMEHGLERMEPSWAEGRHLEVQDGPQQCLTRCASVPLVEQRLGKVDGLGQVKFSVARLVPVI